ncbi:zinc finger protein basonuclin-1 isoform X2 [Myripristis murdjan]|uniref:Basonuclin zinc finger protein 1 n=1 Tax=Myripristis murdjan TaxID=586833 RepID=A0A667WLJ1_9TELE|nr:zinc finger protein basonuclin-1 isoform X2 [Myripristis murdjan]
MSPAICCTLVNCNCDSFKPGKLKRRQCENCKHGWVAHALSKLKVHHMYQSSQVEIVHSNVVFDICSLMLYGTQAIPVRLKILLDRLFSVLKQEEVIQILNALDWTLQDYIRGYVLQDVAGKVLDRWAIMTFEEEIATLQQFLRFGETKSIVELMALQDKEGQAVLVPSTRTNSDIRTFIERSTPRAAAGLSAPKVEKLSGSNVHHFENFINSMAFMLPFQLLGSVPAPLLGSPPGVLQQHQQHQQPGHGPMEPNQRRDDQGHGRDNPLSLPHPPTESSLLGSSSASFTSDLDRGGDNPMDGLSATTKMEVDDFPTSDNYSDGPSTPCTPSMSSEVTQMSPESKLRSLDRNGGSGGGLAGGGGGGGGGGSGSSLKKGRVFCSACEKTFYDKGTLKIHYNAVHLKIKHKCTIEGCNMVFSSLRSRNRHSANPNPRLHMPMNRNNRDKDLRSSLSADEGSEPDKRSEYSSSIPVSSAESHKSVPSYMVSHVDTNSKLHSSSFPSMGQSGILFPNLKTVQPVLPFYRSLVTPAELANTPGTLPSLPLLSSSVPLKPNTAPEPCTADPIPKKKSRKSSMPIKIEKEAVERDDGMDKGSSSEDEAPLQGRDRDECYSKRGGGGGGGGNMYAKQAGEEKDMEKDERGVYISGEGGAKHFLDQSSEREEMEGKENDEALRQVETGVITRMSPPFDGKLRENHRENHPLCRDADDNEHRDDKERVNSLHAVDKLCDLGWEEGEHKVTNGGALQLSDREREEPDACLDNCADSGLSHLDADANLPHHCEICSKTFKNPYSVKMHYRNVHLKEMHMCTVDGCNAAFPSRRSRDRHSANLNLHHKLLTKDTFGPANPLYSPSSHCRDRDSVGLDFCPDPRDRELPSGQTSVIFRGHNRMGLVFPMSKMSAAPDISDASPLGDLERAGGGEGGGEDGAVLDLSTSSSAPARGSGSARSSWDSDGAGSEEGEGMEEEEEALPMEDSDESCDGIGVGRPGGEELVLGGERTLGCVGGGQGGLQGGGGGSPITCHVCQKVYSNKGTFRAHYKTVHLRLLHKCKVPGCDTSFSSVRSRNRHSQNPNLHRNLAVSSSTSLDQE